MLEQECGRLCALAAVKKKKMMMIIMVSRSVSSMVSLSLDRNIPPSLSAHDYNLVLLHGVDDLLFKGPHWELHPTLLFDPHGTSGQ